MHYKIHIATFNYLTKYDYTLYTSLRKLVENATIITFSDNIERTLAYLNKPTKAINRERR